MTLFYLNYAFTFTFLLCNFGGSEDVRMRIANEPYCTVFVGHFRLNAVSNV